MTTDLRRRSTPHHASAARHSLVPRLGLALLAACAISLLLAVGTASALVVTVGGQKYGVQPHATSVEDFHGLPESPLHYGGGPVVHSNSIYAIYWDPSVTESGRIAKYHGEWIELIDQFFEGVAAESGTVGNIFALTGQYTESNGLAADYSTTFRGSATDTDSYPTSGCTDPDPTLNQDFECLTDAQLRTELRSYISSHKLTAGPGAIFYVLTPPDVTVCTDSGTTNGHCSDSSRTNPWTAFANSP
ncbi:MAG TPA: hypothetical protein VK761_01230, partial [Solirubrobacteraceae bacterium]|nr:hypothetical protein [Solirubrobacteraceae bacterium]